MTSTNPVPITPMVLWVEFSPWEGRMVEMTTVERSTKTNGSLFDCVENVVSEKATSYPPVMSMKSVREEVEMSYK